MTESQINPEHLRLYKKVDSARKEFRGYADTLHLLNFVKYLGYVSSVSFAGAAHLLNSTYPSGNLLAVAGGVMFLGIGVASSYNRSSNEKKAAEKKRALDQLKDSDEYVQLESIIADFKKDDAWPFDELAENA